MKVVSVSLGSPVRDKTVTITMGSHTIELQRIGTNGDVNAAALKLKELEQDPEVTVLCVGGTNLGTYLDGVYYEYKCIKPMVEHVKNKPLVDGSGIKRTMESELASFLDVELVEYIQQNGGRKVLVVCGVERWDMSISFVNAGYDFIFGDMMFVLGVPIPVTRLSVARLLAKFFVPLTTRFFPFEWLYPVGEQQNKRVPKYTKYYDWATVIAGDCLYIKQHMPERLWGKIIVTNTTTDQDVQDFIEAGVKYLVTTTPEWEGRSFGTNVLEAILVAISGTGRKLSLEELAVKVKELGLRPHIRQLN